MAFLTPKLRITLMYSSILRHCWTITGSPTSVCTGGIFLQKNLQHVQNICSVCSDTAPENKRRGRIVPRSFRTFSQMSPVAKLLPLPMEGKTESGERP